MAQNSGSFINYPSFSAGEISPDLYGRVDQELYYTGLRKCSNFMVRQYGGASNRPGMAFTAESKIHSRQTRLIPFQFNEEQTYALEFGHLYMRVIKDGAEVLNAAKNITGATKADPCVITSVAHGFSNGDDVYIADVLGMVELNGRTFRIANVAADTFELQDFLGNNIDSTGYTTYSSGGTAATVYTLVTPYQEDHLFELNYAQSNDVLTVTHPSYYPRDITRSAHNSWSITEFANEEGPFKSTNTTATTLIAGATTGNTTLTASAALFNSSWVGELIYLEQMPTDTTKRWEVGKAITSTNIRRAGAHYYEATNSKTTGTFRPDHTEGTQLDGDDGVSWKYLHSGFGIARVTAYTDSTHVDITVIKRLPDNVTSLATDIWARSAWSATEGYPASVAYHKQRLCFGGTTNQPNGLWLSGAGARTYFGTNNPILDDDAITMLLDTTQVNAIRHLVPFSELVVLTSASEQLINGPSDVISATDPPFSKVQGYTGSSKVIPIIVNGTALFVQDFGSVVRSLAFNLSTDAFTGIDLSARSPHLFRNKSIVDWAYHRHPLSIVWCIMDDGTLNGFTFMEEQQVYAWHPHETDGEFESVCCIREGTETAAYFVIKREIGGQTVRYIERMASRYFEDIVDAVFVDSGLDYDGRNETATTITISGGTTWNTPEALTLTASASIFKSTDVGDQIVFRYDNDDGIEIALRLTISAYTSGTVVSAIPTKLIPAAFRNTARTDWAFARNVFQPLWHLEGKAVSVLADGNVVEGLTVEDGKITLPQPAAVVHIGLPYTADLETLDMAQPQGQSKAKTVNIPRVNLSLQDSRGVFVGTNGFDRMYELKQRSPSIGYDSPTPAETDTFEIQVDSAWSKKGRIAVRQSYPLPATITCITPEVMLGYS